MEKSTLFLANVYKYVYLHSNRLTLQCGQTNPLMFSTIPRTGILVFLQNVNSLLTSATDTPYQGRRICIIIAHKSVFYEEK